MKKIILLSVSIAISLSLFGQTQKDGTPDMRYKVNKQTYGTGYNSSQNSSYNAPSYNNTTIITPTNNNSNQKSYNNGGEIKLQNGYYRKNGTYIKPHIKTSPDYHKWNNLKS